MISKTLVYHAWKQVKKSGGGPGVDGVTLEEFEGKLKDNLYKLWNRMSSGSYVPQAVKRVEIPKATGGVRPLGVPTVTDRVAQAVVALSLGPRVESRFHPDS